MILPLPPLPAGASDCHMHVLGPFARFPLAAERAYTVPEAPLEAHERMKRATGLERTVLVQASGHGDDNRAMLAALSQLGARGRAIAVVSQSTTPPELRNMHAAGVRGLRLNLATLSTRYGSDYAGLVSAHERLLAPLGWHLQVFVSSDTLLKMKDALGRCSVPVVVDHMGLPDAAQGIGQPGFQAMLELAALPHVWVKLAGADRITRSSGRLRDAIPFMRALAAVSTERLVWGSDWPHIGFHAGKPAEGDAVLPYRKMDERELLAVLLEAIPDPSAQRAVLAENPAKLYGFARVD